MPTHHTIVIAAALCCTGWIIGCTSGGQAAEVCSGAADPCDQLAAADCGDQRGCQLATRCEGQSTCGPADGNGSCSELHCYAVFESCDGTAAVCSAITYDALCDAQPSCQWNVGTSSCDGSDFDCADNAGLDSCDRQPSCAVTVSCQAGDCSLRDEFSCQITPGCELAEGCTGDASPCDSLDVEADCRAQQGCGW